MNKKKRFNEIVRKIKNVEIQGAKNVARAALEAYFLLPSKDSKEKLMSSRPTEPMMFYVLNLAEKGVSKKEILNHFEFSQKEINKHVLKLINNRDVIFTHCHSTNVVNSLIYSKKKGKKFKVYNTETRPLFQGRKTAVELMKNGIDVTMFVDSAAAFAIKKDDKSDKIYVDKIFLGADALLKKGVINKIGSGMFAEIASRNKIPVYIIADSWKFTKDKIKIEQRSLNEVWDKSPKNIKIKNPAFEFIKRKYISGIITELGLMKYKEFLRKIN
ncbi:MAG TPA: hypothetical protein PKW70_02235 [Candidatus Pacearchaeota archaeon]|nr:hypothetical protein [Candidatus Pacearchaeota archaeon]HOU79428.1 hypothetical protein [Candidatus Pacearchaeota archaeon]HPJ87284.1 hypothetical protein [Candidatus Pacearchaeota archaeon]